MPQCVLCNWRGFAILPSRPSGVLQRRKCDSVEAYVYLFNTWDTPAFADIAFFWSPQLPVANEYFRPFVIVFAFTARLMLNSLWVSIH